MSKKPSTSESGTNPPHTNRLARETSPYLLQHQHNPVDWYPWGDEAFERAARGQADLLPGVCYGTPALLALFGVARYGLPATPKIEATVRRSLTRAC